MDNMKILIPIVSVPTLSESRHILGVFEEYVDDHKHSYYNVSCSIYSFPQQKQWCTKTFGPLELDIVARWSIQHQWIRFRDEADRTMFLLKWTA